MNGLANCVGNFTISMNREMIDVTSLSSPVKRYIPSDTGTTANMLLLVPNDYFDVTYSYIRRCFSSYCYQRFLGKGTMCNHCKTVYPVGVLLCSQCGSTDMSMNGVLEKESDAIITSFDINSNLGDSIYMQIELAYPNGFNFYSDTYTNLKNYALYSLFGTPTHWLCQWCGLFVDRDRITCPGCGGNKLSIRELSSLNRNCIYCGTETVGGYACPNCSGRLRPDRLTN